MMVRIFISVGTLFLWSSVATAELREGTAAELGLLGESSPSLFGPSPNLNEVKPATESPDFFPLAPSTPSASEADSIPTYHGEPDPLFMDFSSTASPQPSPSQNRNDGGSGDIQEEDDFSSANFPNE